MKYLLIALLIFGCSKKTIKTVEIIENIDIETIKKVIPEKPIISMLKIPNLLTLHFDFNKYDINSVCLISLKENINFLFGFYDVGKSYKSLLLCGHCDKRGTNEYNLALGEMRAKEIKDYLIQAGYPADLIEIISYGEERPISDIDSKNRRVEIKIIER